jgi:hypothetical protein
MQLALGFLTSHFAFSPYSFDRWYSVFFVFLFTSMIKTFQVLRHQLFQLFHIFLSAYSLGNLYSAFVVFFFSFRFKVDKFKMKFGANEVIPDLRDVIQLKVNNI